MTWAKLLAREDVDLTTIHQIDKVFFTLLEEFGYSKDDLFTTFKQKSLVHFVNVDAVEWGRKAYQKYFSTPEQIKGYYEQGIALLERIENESSQLDDVPAALGMFRKQFEELCPIFSITSWIAIEGWQHDFEDVLNKLLKQNDLGNRREEVISAITRPWKPTALNEIQKRLVAGESPDTLAAAYAYLGNWAVVWTRSITPEWVESLRRDKEPHTNVISFEEALALLNPSEEEKRMLELAPYLFFFKDWRDDLRRKHAYGWRFLFDKIASHFGVEHDDLGYLSLAEIEEALKNDLLPTETIEHRKGNLTIVQWDNGVKILDKDIPEQYLNIVKDVEDQSAQQHVKGLVAYAGKAQGIARVIRSHHELKRFEPGDILVANTTHPNFLPAMQQASAFVTNEGGISSHAAIVARELKKPCIVGTKNATKAFKDGDLVEVDADAGIARRVT